MKYKCGMCGELSTADEWNRETGVEIYEVE